MKSVLNAESAPRSESHASRRSKLTNGSVQCASPRHGSPGDSAYQSGPLLRTATAAGSSDWRELTVGSVVRGAVGLELSVKGRQERRVKLSQCADARDDHCNKCAQVQRFKASERAGPVVFPERPALEAAASRQHTHTHTHTHTHGDLPALRSRAQMA
jgi:hypothetical protein